MEHYFYDGENQQDALITGYHLGLVGLSVIVACLASYAALSIVGRIKAAEQTKSNAWQLWLITGSLTMGGGVWAMHFIAMLALKLPLAVSYDILMTALSTLPVVVCSAVMLFVLSRPRNKKASLFIGGVLMGAGIGAMHYIGMAAMKGIDRQLVMAFEPKLFATSVVVAVALANVALFTSYYWQRSNNPILGLWKKIIPTLVMGFAVSGMHYTAMAATYFFSGAAIVNTTKDTLDSGALVFWVAFTSISITSLAILMTIVDSRIQQATHEEAISRSRMREAIESLADGFSLYDTNDRLVECNQRYRELMDSGIGVLPGMTFESIIRAAAKAGLILGITEHIDDWIAERLASHRAPRGQFIENFRDDRWIRVSERRIWNIGTVAIYTDITELKCTEIELSKAMNEAQEARAAAENTNRAKSAFLANMSHELRTPMNAIIGYTEMLLEDAQDSEHDETIPDLQKILTASKHLLLLINEILDLSKIEAGKMEIYLETVDLPVIIYEVTDTIRPLVEKNNNTLVVECQEGLPPIYTDLTKLRQGLFNLLSNASKFTENGNITFSVKTESFDGIHGILFCVADTGIGMSEDQAEKVFEAFTQADNSTTRKYGGTGLGLTITKKFCQMMGGEISVSSKLGVGSTFDIWLPIKAEEETD